jgi:hypothetical protein
MPDADQKQQAEQWVAEEIARWRDAPYEDLAAREGDAIHVEVVDPSGKAWIRETQVFWDDRRERTIRVTVDVWDPARRISRSVAIEAFIRAPDGSFVDE